jgi:hypothetical protein
LRAHPFAHHRHELVQLLVAGECTTRNRMRSDRARVNRDKARREFAADDD